MKSKNKKIVLFALTILALICLFAFAACGTKSENGGSSGTASDGGLYDPTKESEKRSLSVAPVKTVELGDEIIVAVTAVNVSGELYWRSSDESVATVDGNGKVTTRSAGETDITVYGGALSATCKLTVEKTFAVPVIKLDSSEITVGTGSKYTVNVSEVTFKGKTVNVTDFKWTVRDAESDIIGIETKADGLSVEITAKKAGETEIYASCKYYGATGVSTVKVKTADMCTVDIEGLEYGGGEYSAVTYTSEYKLLGYDYSTEIPFGVTIYKNGIKVDKEPDFTVEDESVAKVENGKIIGLKEGKTVIYCDYENTRKVINFTCERPAVVLDGQENAVVDLSVSENLTLTKTEGIVGTVSKVMFKSGENADYVEAGGYSGGVISIDKNLTTAEMGDGTFKLVTENVDYVFDGSVYTMVIDSAETLNGLSVVAKNQSAEADVYDGYFVLGADLVLPSGYSFNEVAVGVTANGSNGFIGVFDGKGYAISGLSVKKGGMFAVTGNSAVIKNVIFLDACVTDSGFINSKGGGTIKNVYIEYKEINVTESCEGFAGTAFVNNGKTEEDCAAKVENCVIISHKAVYNSADLTYGKLFILGGTSSVNGVYSNVLATVKQSVYNNRSTCYGAKAYVNANDGYIVDLSTAAIGEKLTTFDKKWDKSFWELGEDLCPIPKTMSV